MDGYEELLPLLDGLPEDDLRALIDGLPEAVVAGLLGSLSADASEIPRGPAEQAKQLDDGYVIREHTQYISDRLAKAKRAVRNGKSRKIIIETPPRVGKSTLVSVYLPLWIMRQHPWKIALISYDSGLTTDWSRQIRSAFEETPALGTEIVRDGGAAGRWTTTNRASIRARSTGQPLTGTGAKVLLIDDPVKDFADAHSPTRRRALWNWWLSVAQTRLEAPYLVVVTMCMTGDTPVLRPDGTETPLRSIRPGDEIATFTDAGEVTTSVVSNWMSQGPDDTFAVHLASGRVVKANARHPFWVIDEDGSGSWVRLESLRAGMKVRCLAEPTGESSAPQTAATSQRSARACACRTTPEHGTRQAIDLPLLLTRADGGFGSKDATASLPRATTDSSLSRMSDARSAEGVSQTSPSLRIGPTCSALTTATTPERCEVCSATTATSSLLAATRPRFFGGPLSTSVVSTDEITSITPAGREEVFDIEVVGTHRFIANGLDVSNTRWHEDDLVGRLLSKEYEGDPDEWEVIRLPALAEKDDLLGRALGEPLLSPIIDETPEQATERWEATRASVGTHTFAALYQQRPAPSEGAIFNNDWWRFWTRDSSKATDDGRVVYLDPASLTGATWLDSWDCTFVKGDSKSDGDYVVGQRWVRSKANRYLVAQQRGRWSFTETLDKMLIWGGSDPVMSPYGHLVHRRLIENKANGPAILNVMQDKISGLKPINPKDSKEARARAVTPEVESGNVYLPLPSDPGNEWVYDYLSEMRNFPHDAHDDQVDSTTQALSQLRDPGQGRITVPGSTPNLSRVTGSLAAAAASDLGKHRARGGYGGR